MWKKYGWLLLIAAFMLAFWLGRQSAGPDSSKPGSQAESLPAVVQTRQDRPLTPANEVSASAMPLPDLLPAQARVTLDLIAHNGPYPHRQDGAIFQNREQLLPKKPRGYYREYTVETPGLNHRGARRIIAGGQPIEVYFYTEDHYRSFRQFEVNR